MAVAAPVRKTPLKRRLKRSIRKGRRHVFGVFSYATFWLARALTRRFSVERCERIGAAFGRAWFRFSPKHRHRALSNLALAFPDMPAEERRALAVRIFEHFGIVGMDFMHADARSDEEVLRSTEVFGIEHAHEAAKLGKGIVFVTGHFGNWERASQALRAHGYPLAIVGRRARHQRMQDNVVMLRQASGNTVLNRGTAVRPLLQALREGRAIALLPDQSHKDVFLEFFGRPAGTALGPAVLAERTGAPMLPGFCHRTGIGTYRVDIFPPIEVPPDVEDRPVYLTQAFTATLEQMIRQHPEQWLWFHDRWRSARQKGLL